MPTPASTPVSPRSWRPLYLGCSRLVLRTHDGLELVLDYFDGGGVARGYAVWRVAGRVAAIAAAGTA